ncbi:PREDICTED: homeobox-leucine zipper protein PROTODERMAL FACTOR 2-like isoform X1 [Prunus mume]|uniref:Homeobox-leucine zipper protein PROTODERMAL FACTOR 2-like isoform X1 n=1 Tax=Prunus mume TaxID=102107 RepID=A0ABM0PTV0_PRUMU|nr:PREDICTED: homeobox-leucine zipper protein PROTODERMAL FACTOR 2-like isoform X1 [Prunus mume]XP_008244377.1 PREDICTED: homeobox-leucine zipper protein PROTODERMAL FACTOR 2-like isoform X1 [Prunus mume]XP_008244378.1 PREDICTED: homeobox-leucine zipper protein PROTODERMAL FACTOR 2-like isoform X1 [Prunus mume]XP_008244379.1 PREDICTED: homeobox-leucine zipper protein PROTODERMAL FACTOR 2-like isoform X1 [Prunus mume]XP_016652299.1 PREDICTED: homeobox-leucine zipper protein PROTODERMAL FACTOR 2-
MEVCARSAGKITKVEGYCESGLDLWVDLKIDSNPENDLDHSDLPQPTASPQGFSTRVQLTDLGSQPILGSNFDTDERGSGLLMSASPDADVSTIKISERASNAMEELSSMAFAQEPLWQVDMASHTEMLSDVEYMRVVKVRECQSPPSLDVDNSHELEPVLAVCSESSRAVEYFETRPISIIELLMDLEQWSLAFSNIVSKATLVGVLASTGVERHYDGTLQLMTAEFHAPSPLVPTRESSFARYCKKLGCGLWGVVDVSPETLLQFPSRNFRRRPSGCLIEEMPNGCSKVIWVEHVVVDNRLVHHFFQPLVTSGFAFCAKRWVNTLIQHFQWSATVRVPNSPTDRGVIIPQPQRTFFLKFSARMVKSFFMDIGASRENKWMPFPMSGADIMISTKSSTDDHGKILGTTVFATSVHLPAPSKQVFSLLRDVKFRRQWDIYGRNHRFDEHAYISNGDSPENGVSILRAINDETKKIKALYMQESYAASTGSYIVYAPFDYKHAENKLMKDEWPDHIPILPSGFSILPDGPILRGETGGSLLTIAFHVVAKSPTDEHEPSNQLGFLMHNIIANTVMSIKEALGFSI